MHAPEEVPWRFFEHSDSEKLFAENVDEKDSYERTALQYAAWMNLPQVKFTLAGRTLLIRSSLKILDLSRFSDVSKVQIQTFETDLVTFEVAKAANNSASNSRYQLQTVRHQSLAQRRMREDQNFSPHFSEN